MYPIQRTGMLLSYFNGWNGKNLGDQSVFWFLVLDLLFHILRKSSKKKGHFFVGNSCVLANFYLFIFFYFQSNATHKQSDVSCLRVQKVCCFAGGDWSSTARVNYNGFLSAAKVIHEGCWCVLTLCFK